MRKIGVAALLALGLFSTGVQALTLADARLQGRVGESQSGYLAAIKPDRETQALVKQINEARSESYRQLALSNNLPQQEVARLAGVPPQVLRRSKELLESFEAESNEQRGILPLKEENQMKLFEVGHEAILEELAASAPDEMTPMEALQLVYRLMKESRKALGFK